MKTRKPLLGLLAYSFNSVIGSLMIVVLYALLLGVLAEITEAYFVAQLFLLNAVSAVPYIVIQKSEGTPKWESYLLAMPIKRKDLATILYLNVFIASLFAIPIMGLVWGAGFVFDGTVMEVFLDGGFTTVALAYGSVLLLATLLYPIASTEFGNRNVQVIFFGCIFISIGISLGIFFGGRWLGLSDVVASLLTIAISVVAFVVSLFITRAMYSKMDF